MMPEQPSSQTQDVQPNLGGRPAFYTDPDTLQAKIDDYFKTCDKGRQRTIITKKGPVTYNEPIPYTVTGLALHLGFKSRQALINYQKRDERFDDTITRAKTMCGGRLMEGSITGEYDTKAVQLNLAVDHNINPAQVVEHHHDVTLSLDQLTQQARSLLAQASPEQLRVLGVDKTDDVIDIQALPDPAQGKG